MDALPTPEQTSRSQNTALKGRIQKHETAKTASVDLIDHHAAAKFEQENKSSREASRPPDLAIPQGSSKVAERLERRARSARLDGSGNAAAGDQSRDQNPHARFGHAVVWARGDTLVLLLHSSFIFLQPPVNLIAATLHTRWGKRQAQPNSAARRAPISFFSLPNHHVSRVPSHVSRCSYCRFSFATMYCTASALFRQQSIHQLEGAAQEWWRRVPAKERPDDWATFKDLLTSRFSSRSSSAIARKQWV